MSEGKTLFVARCIVLSPWRFYWLQSEPVRFEGLGNFDSFGVVFASNLWVVVTWHRKDTQMSMSLDNSRWFDDVNLNILKAFHLAQQ